MKRNPQVTDYQKLQIAAQIAIDTGDNCLQAVEGRDGGIRGFASIDSNGKRTYHPYERSLDGFLNYGCGDGVETVYRLDGVVAKVCHNKNFVDDSGYIEGDYE